MQKIALLVFLRFTICKGLLVCSLLIRLEFAFYIQTDVHVYHLQLYMYNINRYTYITFRNLYYMYIYLMSACTATKLATFQFLHC